MPAALRLRLDVTDEESVSECLAAAGEIDVLVNNAAIAESGPLETFPLDRLRACFETNTIGALRMVQGVVPGMRERGRGAIVNISSVNGRVSAPLAAAYAATKFALEAMSESLHYELGHFGIRTVLVEPGFIAPGMKPGAEWGMVAPYDELAAQYRGGDGKLLGDAGRPGPEIVGEAIWDAITTDDRSCAGPSGRTPSSSSPPGPSSTTSSSRTRCGPRSGSPGEPRRVRRPTVQGGGHPDVVIRRLGRCRRDDGDRGG